MKHVLIFGSYGPSIKLFRLDLIKFLLDRGYRVSVLIPSMSTKEICELQGIGVTVYEMNFERNKINLISDILLFLLFFGMGILFLPER